MTYITYDANYEIAVDLNLFVYCGSCGELMHLKQAEGEKEYIASCLCYCKKEAK